MIIKIDGQELELAGIDPNTIVIARPIKQLSSKALRRFGESLNGLSHACSQFGIRLLVANHEQLLLDVIYPKVSEAQH